MTMAAADRKVWP